MHCQYLRHLQNQLGFKDGADDRIRTGDPLITNEMLYQLSYVGLSRFLLGVCEFFPIILV